MKTTITKKFFAFILLMSGVFFVSFLNAQDCPTNKVWACRTDECGIQECKCINANLVESWTAVIPKCSWKWPHHGGFWAINQGESELGMQTSLQVNSDFQSNATTISFSLAESQNVSLKIFDVNGRLVTTLADRILDKGESQLEWNTENVIGGIYFIQFQLGEKQERVKLVVVKP